MGCILLLSISGGDFFILDMGLLSNDKIPEIWRKIFSPKMKGKESCMYVALFIQIHNEYNMSSH